MAHSDETSPRPVPNPFDAAAAEDDPSLQSAHDPMLTGITVEDPKNPSQRTSKSSQGMTISRGPPARATPEPQARPGEMSPVVTSISPSQDRSLDRTVDTVVSTRPVPLSASGGAQSESRISATDGTDNSASGQHPDDAEIEPWKDFNNLLKLENFIDKNGRVLDSVFSQFVMRYVDDEVEGAFIVYQQGLAPYRLIVALVIDVLIWLVVFGQVINGRGIVHSIAITCIVALATMIPTTILEVLNYRWFKAASERVQLINIGATRDQLSTAYYLVNGVATALTHYPGVENSDVCGKELCTYITSIPICLMGFMTVALGRPRFIWVVPIMLLTIFAMFVVRLWVDKPGDTTTVMGYKIVMQVLLGIFVLVVKRLDERTQRQQFQEVVIASARTASLSKRREALATFVKRSMPPELSSRIAKGVSTEHIIIDSSPNAVCIIVQVAKSEAFAQRQVPTKSAMALAAISSVCTSHARRMKLDHIRSVGDATCVTANLIRPSNDPQSAALVFGLLVLNTVEVDVVCAIHSGAMIGTVAGTNVIRYDIGGPALECAQRLVLLGEVSALTVTAPLTTAAVCKKMEIPKTSTSIEISCGKVDVFTIPLQHPPSFSLSKSTGARTDVASLEQLVLPREPPLQFVDQAGSTSIDGANLGPLPCAADVIRDLDLSQQNPDHRRSSRLSIVSKDPPPGEDGDEKATYGSTNLNLRPTNCGTTFEFESPLVEEEFQLYVKENRRSGFIASTVIGLTFAIAIAALVYADRGTVEGSHEIASMACLGLSFFFTALLLGIGFRKIPAVARFFGHMLPNVLLILGAAFSSKSSDIVHTYTYLVYFSVFLAMYNLSTVRFTVLEQVIATATYYITVNTLGNYRFNSDWYITWVVAVLMAYFAITKENLWRTAFIDMKISLKSLEVVEQDQRYREAVVRATIPTQLFDSLQLSLPIPKTDCWSHSETVSLAIDCHSSLKVEVSSPQVLAASLNQLDSTLQRIESALNRMKNVEISIVKLFGSHILIAGPIYKQSTTVTESAVHAAVAQALLLIQKLLDDGITVRAGLAIEQAVLVLIQSQYPLFDIFGRSVSLARSMAAEAPAPMVVATERFLTVYQDRLSPELKQPITLCAAKQETWRIRFMGITKIYKLRSSRRQGAGEGMETSLNGSMSFASSGNATKSDATSISTTFADF